MANIKKILVVGPAWVGDMVMAQTLFKVLKQQDAQVQIDVLAPDWTRALLNRMPEVNKAISMPIGHGKLALKQRLEIGRSLQSERYDQAIVLPNSWKSALIPFFAGIQKRTGWRGEMRYGLLNDVRSLDKQSLPLMIQRFMALGLPPKNKLPMPYPYPQLVVSHASLQASIAKHQLTIEKPILAMCPGAEFGPSKRWPAEYFADVAREYIRQGYQVWLFGSKNDQSVADIIQAGCNQACINLIGKTTLDEAIDLLSLAKKVVSNDSGLMHIAAALGRPLVAMYGSTSTAFTPPLSQKVKIVNLKLECSPCFKRECPLGHWKCMKDMKPEMVVQALKDVEL